MQRTITRQMSFDLTKLLVSEDWFSDISPQTMRRLLNIVSITGKKLSMGSVYTMEIGVQRICLGVRWNNYSSFNVTGRLLRANHIIFNWDRLASWIHLTEEWPYRTSWIILFLEETDGVSDQVTLKTLYERYTQTVTIFFNNYYILFLLFYLNAFHYQSEVAYWKHDKLEIIWVQHQQSGFNTDLFLCCEFLKNMTLKIRQNPHITMYQQVAVDDLFLIFFVFHFYFLLSWAIIVLSDVCEVFQSWTIYKI